MNSNQVCIILRKTYNTFKDRNLNEKFHSYLKFLVTPLLGESIPPFYENFLQFPTVFLKKRYQRSLLKNFWLHYYTSTYCNTQIYLIYTKLFSITLQKITMFAIKIFINMGLIVNDVHKKPNF